MSPINLRFDLRRLSDAEIATRFEADLAREHLSRDARPCPRDLISNRLAHEVRCLFDAPVGGSLIGPADGWMMQVLLLPIFVLSGWLLAGTEARIYLLDCGILDARDEMVSRVGARRRGAT